METLVGPVVLKKADLRRLRPSGSHRSTISDWNAGCQRSEGRTLSHLRGCGKALALWGNRTSQVEVLAAEGLQQLDRWGDAGGEMKYGETSTWA